FLGRCKAPFAVAGKEKEGIPGVRCYYYVPMTIAIEVSSADKVNRGRGVEQQRRRKKRCLRKPAAGQPLLRCRLVRVNRINVAAHEAECTLVLNLVTRNQIWNPILVEVCCSQTQRVCLIMFECCS